MRLEVVDLLDERLGRKWAGLTPTGDRRGTIGTLQAWTDTIHEGRQFTTARPDTVVTHCAYLRRHLFWATEQDWISDMSGEIKNLHRALSDAAGIYRRPPVGRCHVIPEDGDKACGGPLFASDYGGVHCARCAASWDANHLRQLGLAQAEQESA
jgi:hypothetical protein